MTVVLLLLIFLIVSGCGLFTDNPHDSWVMISEHREKELGESGDKKLQENIGFYESDTLTTYVQSVGSRLAVYSDRPELDFKFKILDTFLVNALALPGGYIYITRGLLKEIDDEAELAGIMAHEIGHVTAYHAVKRTQLAITSIITAVATAGQTGGRSIPGGLMATDMMSRGYTRTAEEQADKLGMRYAAAAGYDSRGLIRALQRLKELSNEIPDEEVLFLRTHPYLEDRIRQGDLREFSYYREKNDTPIVNFRRYQRFCRHYLFTAGEEVLLDRLDQLVSAYKNQDTEGIKVLLHEKFEVGSQDDTRDSQQFLQELSQRFETIDKIEYNYNLMELDVGDTDARIVYNYKEKNWIKGKDKPILIRNYQEFIWRREEDEWKLMRLR